MTTKLYPYGGAEVTIADPAYEDDGFELSYVDVGSLHELADGTIAYDCVGYRYRLKLRWKRIGALSKATVRAKPSADSHLTIPQ